MKYSVRILMLVVLTLTLLAASPDNRLERSAKCRSLAASGGQCPRLPYTVYYTDASKTVECGWFDACQSTGDGCYTQFYTRTYYPCCDPPINP